MCSLASGSRRDDSSSSSSWWWRTKPRHGQPSPQPSASLRVIQAKGVQRLPTVGSEAPTGVWGHAVVPKGKPPRPTPPLKRVLVTQGCLVRATAER